MKIKYISGFDAVEDFASFSDFQKAYPSPSANFEVYLAEVNRETFVNLNPENVRKLSEYKGTVIILVRPGWVAIPYLVVAAGAYYGYRNLKKLINSFKKPNIKEQKTDAFSNPTNRLEPRQNTVRIGGRIPDIMGQVRIVPDLIAPPIRFFENNVETEVVHYILGVGDYLLEDAREDLTPIQQIAGSTVLFYRPGKWPGSVIPDALVGSDVSGLALQVRKYYGKPITSVNGQTLKPPNAKDLVGDSDIVCEYPNIIKTSGSINFLDYYEVGQAISALDTPGFTFTRSSVTYNLGPFSGKVLEAYSDYIVIDHTWPNFGADSPDLSPTFYSNGDRIVGPFKVEKINDLPYSTDNRMELFFNFYAPSGLQYTESDVRRAEVVTIGIKIEALNPSGALSGDVYNTTFQVEGSGVTLSSVGKTLGVNLNSVLPGNFGVQVSVWRDSATRSTTNQNVTDELIFKDLFVVHYLPGYLEGTGLAAFENLTSVTSISKATNQTSQAGSRKLNCLVTRKLQTYNDDGTLATIAATKKARDAFLHCSLNSKIGNFNSSEIDEAQICTIFKSVETYFGSAAAAEFSHTFDQLDITAEETLTLIADAAFCSVYRRNNQLRIIFEKKQDNSIMLFNHRNMIPGSEKRSIRFGGPSDDDGIEFEYINPADDLPKTIYLPTDRSALKPFKIKATGVRQSLQAHFHANRLYNKLKFQNKTTSFSATEEAYLVELDQRVLVADQTRPNIQDGEVLGQVGLVLELSQPYEMVSGQTYSIFLQHKNNTVESIPITAGVDEYHVVLNSAPALELVTSYEKVVRTGYLIVGSADTSSKAFVITSKQPSADSTFQIDCVNYDARVFGNDLDFINGVVDGGSVPIIPDPEPEAPGTVNRTIYVNSNRSALVLKTLHDATYAPAVSGDSVTFIFVYGITLNSTGADTPAVDTGTWAAGVNLKIINQTLSVIGAGGNGSGPGQAQRGGTALKVRSAVTIDNALGGFKAGGGGGAGTDQWFDRFSNSWQAGGGGGAGSPPGLGHDVASSTNRSDGANGSLLAGGRGGDFGSASDQPSEGGGWGGNGGGLGGAGENGGDYTRFGSEDNLGGAAGYSVEGNSLVTWIATGVRVGPLLA